MLIQRKTGACCQNPRMDVGPCTSDIYSDEERTPGDLFQRKHRENAQAGCFSLFPSLRFSIWIKWGVHVGRGRGVQGCWEIACWRKDILHLPIQSVVFSNFEMKEKNADRVAPKFITVDGKEQKNLRSNIGEASCMRGIFIPPLRDLLFWFPVALSEPIVTDEMCVLDRAATDWPRARCSFPIVSQR